MYKKKIIGPWGPLVISPYVAFFSNGHLSTRGLTKKLLYHTFFEFCHDFPLKIPSSENNRPYTKGKEIFQDTYLSTDMFETTWQYFL